MDGKDVQDGAVPEGTTSGDGTSEAATPQPLTREDFQKMLADSEERTQRLVQSRTDKLRSEVMKGQGTPDYGNVLGALGDADPEVKAKVYEDFIKRQQTQQAQAAQAEQQRATREQFDVDWRELHSEPFKDAGIDPSDKRLDYGEGGDYTKREKVLLASFVRLQKETNANSSKDAKKAVEEAVAQAAKEAGLESNTALGGASGPSEDAFTEGFNSGRLNSPADRARAKKLLYG